MRRFLQLLVLAAVLACGIHPGEPAMAHEDAAHHLLHAESHLQTGDGEDGHQSSDRIAHAGHNHCPLAPDADSTGGGDAPFQTAAPPFAYLVKPLESLSRAPPVEPPSA